MSKFTQREAVYNAISNVFSEHEVEFEDGQTPTAETIFTENPSFRQEVAAILVEGFKGGEIELADTPSNQEKLKSDSKMKTYVSGLVSNWLRKDKRLNGNVTYVAKNPGSRAGSGDESLKTMRTLMKKYSDDPTKAKAIQVAIDKRVSELAAEKAKTFTVSAEAIAKLPPEIQALIKN